jgi:ABC-type Fe3+/spermidine/putrescine transport system ATPase subunit
MNHAIDPILKVQNLCNRYQELPLLKNINFSLHKGEILCLLGPSGSGKTTLLRLLAGLEEADSGSIIFNGRELAGIAPHKRNFGMMFQEYALFPHKNVRENIAFGLEMQQCPAARLQLRVDTMLDLVGLRQFAHRRIDELSGGERQRVALARSLAPEPQLLLLDEPLGSLDRTLRDRLTIEIRTILKSLGVTTIFVTHDQAEAFSIADKVAILHQGVLQQIADPETLYRQPKNTTVAAFLGFTNLLTGSLDAGGICHCPIGNLPVVTTPRKARDRVTLLIRPEGTKITDPALDYPPGCPLLSGMIIARLFLGSSYRVTLQCGRHSLTFDLPLDPPPGQLGEAITLMVNPAAIVVLA